MNKENGNVYKVNEKGFISEGYWDRTINYMAIDENGEKVDCYSSVVGDINERHNRVNRYYKREKFKNFLLNFTFKFQLGFLIFSLVTTFITLIIYICNLVSNNDAVIVEVMEFLERKLKPAIFAKVSCLVNPAVMYVERYGLENVLLKSILILTITSFIALIIYMIGRDHITVRWLSKLLHITPICEIKVASDKRIMRLQSDLYSIQLRRHEVKYASHK